MTGKGLTGPARIALVAHDGRKQALIEWVRAHRDLLDRHFLFGTGTTARMISRETGLSVFPFKSGPLGGDQQIGARIAEGELDALVFFWDPLDAAPHDHDVKALLRIAVLYDLPAAYNEATATLLFSCARWREGVARARHGEAAGAPA